ncbi:AAA family ATPase [Swingsia samuiensis]|uniref:Chromosome partition protein Smc n=1 Tax=Swingsia samuiensis TaxID=1293412 RepID=A0A4Y6UMQ9_9PROT|nr:AAA family ATPase [Swingsia samuiensis]QDH17671.1 chromosome segregation protein SMC [Swingsia samuiensis]
MSSQQNATILGLTITGFKSFADEVQVNILPGLTGIIGPNGCGKSNVVEALRWAMGETSARSLRGGELDDLIFAGTGARSARNIAQVMLRLSGTKGLAPSPFQDADELEISRRIERGAGSEYRINGRVVRARDIQTLFADLSSGARSSGIVSQNRVSQLIAAKPEERRLLLEEAAGITGLHTRRHDAELKLRQTEANLSRAEDLRLQIEERLSSLNTQTSQARKYRELSELLRETENTLHHLLHAKGKLAVEKSLQDLKSAKEKLQAAEMDAEQAAIAEFEARQASPHLHENIEKLRSQLEHHKIKQETLRADLFRAQENEKGAQNHLSQIESDLLQNTQRLTQYRASYDETQQKLILFQEQIQELPEQEQQLAKEAQKLSEEQQSIVKQLDQTTQQRDTESAALKNIILTIENIQNRIDTESQNYHKTALEISELDKTLPQEDAILEIQHKSEEADLYCSHIQNTFTEHQKDLQEKLLQSELSKRTLEEETKRFENILRMEKDLQDRLKNIETQLQENHDLFYQNKKNILDDNAKNELQKNNNTLKNKLNELEREEISKSNDLSQTNTEWLEARAQAEEQIQRYQAIIRSRDTAQRVMNEAKKKVTLAQENLERDKKALIPAEELTSIRETTEKHSQHLSKTQSDIQKTEKDLLALLEGEKQTQQSVFQIENAIIRLKTEQESLQISLNAIEKQPNSLEDSLNIPPHLVRAVSAVLANGLNASLADETTPATQRWRELPNISFSAEAAFGEPLSNLIEAPPALNRRLQSAFLLADQSLAKDLQKKLSPGQILVCENGALWRWDGFIRSAHAADTGAVRLEQKNRLNDILLQITQHETDLPDLVVTLQNQSEQREKIEKDLQLYRQKSVEIEHSLNKQRAHMAQLEQRADLAQSRWEESQKRLEEALQNLQHAKSDWTSLEEDYTAFENPEKFSQKSQKLSEKVTLQRKELEATSLALKTCRKEVENHTRLLDQALLQHQSAQTRDKEISSHITHMTKERNNLQSEISRVSDNQNKPDLELLNTTTLNAQKSYADSEKQLQILSQDLLKAQENKELLHTNLRQIEQLKTQTNAHISSLLARRKELETLLQNLQKEREHHQNTLSECPDLSLLEQKISHYASKLEETRSRLKNIENQLSHTAIQKTRLAGDISAQESRIDDLKQQIHDTQSRSDELNSRQNAIKETIQQSQSQILELETHYTSFTNALAQTSAEYEEALLKNKAAHSAEQTIQERRRKADATLSAAQANIARFSERAEQAKAAYIKLQEEIPFPDSASTPLDVSEHNESSIRRQINRLTKEREDLGPVNLRAEIEFQEAKQTAETIAKEHDELTTAIQKLRQGIHTINGEGRERLLAVFTEVDRNFQSLFSRMFGGGRAHLGMVGSDDPLEAGLEIFAQPPGKKLSTLSLLSGGEQALTALSLIFATFRCNPAPICVLDEVDAPLDDANVERFCSLLSDMTKETGTHFLVVTHHQLTMAHMNRLYGVTMQERGVSRVLSVDLGQATTFVNH